MLIAKLNSGVSPPFGSPGRTVMSADKNDESTSFKQPLKIGTWNVRTMAQASKIDNSIHEMKRMKIEILGINEMRWLESGDMEKGHRILRILLNELYTNIRLSITFSGTIKLYQYKYYTNRCPNSRQK
uniref:Craniofacial development protein 2 n=1 Tax=Sipha flava TaxID=143950 RepID=A0A2S2R952_9HEMI